MNKLPGAANALVIKSVLSTLHLELSKMKTKSEDLQIKKIESQRKDSNLFAHQAVADSDAD